MNPKIELLHFYISPGHNYFGHHGKPAGENPMHEVSELECVAGAGVRGDRFLGHEENYKGQITFFAAEVYESLCAQFRVFDKSPAAFRRNVVTRGCDLRELIGQEFEIQGLRFFGTETCKPCYWMDRAFHPGAEDALQGRGGLRGKILTSGILRLDSCALATGINLNPTATRAWL